MSRQAASRLEPKLVRESSLYVVPPREGHICGTFTWLWIGGLASALVVLSLGLGLRVGRVSTSDPQLSTPQATVSVIAPVLPADLPGTTTLKAVRYSSKAGFTAIEIQLDRPVAVRADTLRHPERVYFDLANTSIADALVSPQTGILSLPVGDRLIRRVRVAPNPESSTRVVLDLAKPCLYSFVMSPRPPYRLMIDVEPQITPGTTPQIAQPH